MLVTSVLFNECWIQIDNVVEDDISLKDLQALERAQKEEQEVLGLL